MTDAKSPEPSIEEILASIRKIISDDEPELEGHEAVPAPVPPSYAEQEPEPDHDDVLELTEVMVSAPPEPERAQPAAPPEPPQHSNVTVLPQPIAQSWNEPESAPRPLAEPDNGLLSSATLEAASGAFARLAHPDGLDTPHQHHSSGVTVEDLARELLKPILRQWIDQNLPPLVERLVARELRKITRKAEDL